MSGAGDELKGVGLDTAHPAGDSRSQGAAVLGDRYALGVLLGQGGMASVYQATDELLGREVAVKVFRSASTTQETIQRHHGEARVLAGLSHPNLVTVFDIGTDTSTLHPQMYLVMELIPGTDLQRAKHQGPFASATAATLGVGIADALADIHGRGIIHRDVKPANILISNDENLHGRTRYKLTDFGIARILDQSRLTATGQSVGTAAYFSPEQAQGGPITSASDVYSLGLVLLETLTGVTAFPGPAAASAVARLHRNPEVPETLGEPWVQLLTRMTAQGPMARPTAADVSATLHNNALFGTEDDFQTGAHLIAQPAAHLLPGTTVEPDNGDLTRPVDVVSGFVGAEGKDTTTGPAPAGSLRNDTSSSSPTTESLEIGTATDTTTQPHPVVPEHRRKPVLRWALIVLAALISILLTVVLLMLVVDGQAQPVPVNYPPASGELGELLTDLQESVDP
ncbi:serine/threonine-protein kinase [Arthrobacter sp. H41]|uniref:serine/threonine-protein kinase n=1 Tax=Arthrobacter sp. H41 TaxID=1312978 RepID=UPI0004BC3A5A|nr:serine/threonine-protein kinase [Arthrobacter sp. H41]